MRAAPYCGAPYAPTIPQLTQHRLSDLSHQGCGTVSPVTTSSASAHGCSWSPVDGLGCDGDMWRALRGWFVFQLVMLGLACFCACCASYTAMTLADMRAEGY